MQGESGGVEQVVLGLAAGLANLPDGDEEYVFLTLDGADEWLKGALSGACRTLSVARRANQRATLRSRVADALPPLARAYGLVHDALVRPKVAVSDGTIERAGIDVVHFTFQDGFRTAIPSIYHPHDLQHVHLPQLFTWRQRRRRESVYGTLCRQAAMVAVASTWVKRDVMEHFGLEEDRVHVVPLAPIIEHYRSPDEYAVRAIRAKFSLPDRFAFFPAQTWPHKNHLGLLEAMAIVRDRHGVTIPLVCSGRLTEFEARIRRRAARLGLAGAVQLLGFVSPEELRALYALARCVVIPSLFEAASFPLWEAFRSGVPAACSNVTSLPEQAGDGALVFDPRDARAMAEALWSTWADDTVRQRLVARGRDRVSRFTWERTARTFRAHYRRLGGRPLAPEDRALLEADPLL